MWTVIWILLLVGGMVFVDKAFRTKPAPVNSHYIPAYIDHHGTIVCVKKIKTRA